MPHLPKDHHHEVGSQRSPTLPEMAVEWLHSDHSAFFQRNFLSAMEIDHLLSLPTRFQASLDAQRTVRKSETARILDQTPVHRVVSARLLSTVTLLSNTSTSHRSNFADAVRKTHPLTLRHLEAAEITRYATGGHYDWHPDGLPTGCQGLATNACRGFTAIVYLDDVPDAAGGATSIRFADGSTSHVQPEAGAALFFHAYLMHRAEPLLIGRKTILNQWIHFRPVPWLLTHGERIGVRLQLHAPSAGAPVLQHLAVALAYRPMHVLVLATELATKRLEDLNGSVGLAGWLLVAWMTLVAVRLTRRVREGKKAD